VVRFADSQPEMISAARDRGGRLRQAADWRRDSGASITRGGEGLARAEAAPGPGKDQPEQNRARRRARSALVGLRAL